MSVTFGKNFPIFRRSRDSYEKRLRSHGNTEVKLPSGNLTSDLGPRYCASSVIGSVPRVITSVVDFFARFIRFIRCEVASAISSAVI